MLYDPLQNSRNQRNLVQSNRERMYAPASPTPIIKAEDNDILIKAEGSRGGKVIGHTKSGKAIYETFEHEGHKGFTKQDHMDSALAHSKANQAPNISDKKFDHHWDHGGKHILASKKKKSSSSTQIGSTKSGKSIHSTHDHEAHKDFSAQDHLDASKIHREKYVEHSNARHNDKGFDHPDNLKHRELHYHHEYQEKRHADSYRDKVFSEPVKQK
jgi:hypothetical protein